MTNANTHWVPYSYHSDATLRSMYRYSIGVLVEPWENKVPPIRGGVFRDPDEKTFSDSDTDLSDASTMCAESTGSEYESDVDSLTLRGKVTNDQDGKHSQANRSTPMSKSDIAVEAYIRKTIQSEIDDDMADYPSLDPDTQRIIEAKYRALHQRVKDEGFYQCHYGEYAKELTRYLSIFAMFLTALYHGWYCTSAALLGLFWVSLFANL